MDIETDNDVETDENELDFDDHDKQSHFLKDF